MGGPLDRQKSLRLRQTGAEARLWRVLRNRNLNGWKFRRQHPIDRYVVDFACVEAKLVVEVDGATHATEDRIARDAARSETIGRCGFEVLRVTNADVYENISGVRETILAAIERRTVFDPGFTVGATRLPLPCGRGLG